MTMSDQQLYCQEDYVHVEHMGTDKEKRISLGYAEPYQTFAYTLGQLYRACLKEHGRPVSKVYVGDGVPVGWVFLKKNPEGAGLIETWVTVFKHPGIKRTVVEGREYADFKRTHKKTALVPKVGP